VIRFSANYRSRQNLEICAQIHINCSKEKLWKVITAPGHLEKYHPFCAYHKSERWNGVGCVDESKSNYGKIVRREVIEWNEGVGYTIKMLNPNQNTTVRFEIGAVEEGVQFKVYLKTNAYRKNPRPFWIFLAPLMIVPSYKKYFHSLLNGIKYYAETDKKVSRNQFGHHRKYSPKPTAR